MNIRKLTESDYKTLEKWWKAYGWETPPAKETLPDNATGGLMVVNEGKEVAACFVYFTNSKTAWIAWHISDPNYRKDDRGKIMEALLQAAELTCMQQGIKCMLALGKSKSVIDRHKKLNWFVDENEAGFEMIKLI